MNMQELHEFIIEAINQQTSYPIMTPRKETNEELAVVSEHTANLNYELKQGVVNEVDLINKIVYLCPKDYKEYMDGMTSIKRIVLK